MSFHSAKKPTLSRRACLQIAAGVAAWPLMALADCPCNYAYREERKDDAAKATPNAAKELRVCADPNNLPYSNRAREGFEDKIAAMIAQELDLRLEYEWLPQRLGFYRTALKTFDSNLVMAAPAGFDKALITRPYYRSSYVFVCRKDRIPIKSFDDPKLRKLRIGVPLTGGANTPPTHALARRQLINNITGYPAFDESEGKPGEKIIADVAAGEIDVAIAWGPQAGYFARQQRVPLQLAQVSPDQDVMDEAVMPFTFEICMALRRSDKDLRDRINAAIEKRSSQINEVLDEYGVPRLALKPPAIDKDVEHSHT